MRRVFIRLTERRAGTQPTLRAAQLDLAGAAILVGPFEAGVVLLARRMAGEIRVFEITARERAHVGASRRDDGVDVTVADDAADRHRRNVQRVSDLVAERRLKDTALGRALHVRYAARRDREDVVAGFVQHAADL